MGVLAFYRLARDMNFEVTQGEDRTADDQLSANLTVEPTWLINILILQLREHL